MASTQGKPILDEASFQRLLAAAYTMQRHNGSLLVKQSRTVPTCLDGSLIPPETANQLFVLASQLDALTQPKIPRDSGWRTQLPVAVAREMLAKGRFARADHKEASGKEASGKAVLQETPEPSEPKSPVESVLTRGVNNLRDRIVLRLTRSQELFWKTTTVVGMAYVSALLLGASIYRLIESVLTRGANSLRDRIVRRLTQSQELFWKTATVAGIAAVSALLLGASIYRLTSLPTGLALPSEGVEQQRTRRMVKPSKSRQNQIVKTKRIGSTLGSEADVVAKDTVIRHNAAGLPVQAQKKLSGPAPLSRTLASTQKTTVKPRPTPSTDGSIADLVAEDTIIRYSTRSGVDGVQTQKRP